MVLFQTRYEAGQEQRFVVELCDAKGLEAIKAAQQAVHRGRLAAQGLPAVVNDLDMLTGGLLVSVQWQASEQARAIKPGDRVEVSLADGTPPLRSRAPVAESRADGVRHKLLLAADPAAISRLHIGDEVRRFPRQGRQVTGLLRVRRQRHADDLLVVAGKDAPVREGGVAPDDGPAERGAGRLQDLRPADLLVPLRDSAWR